MNLVEAESTANPIWETTSGLICVVAFVLIVAAVQIWPRSGSITASEVSPDVEQLSKDWARAPVLQRITQSKSFKQSKKEHQTLIVWGWLDKSSPKRFQALSGKSKEAAVQKTIERIKAGQGAKLSATTLPRR